MNPNELTLIDASLVPQGNQTMKVWEPLFLAIPLGKAAVFPKLQYRQLLQFKHRMKEKGRFLDYLLVKRGENVYVVHIEKQEEKKL